MKKTRKLRSQKVGLAPGALVHVGERRTEQPDIALFEYDAASLRETRFDSIDASREHARGPGMLWLNVHGLHEPEVMAEIGRRFNLHPLVLEDILNTDQRPKVDEYGDYIFIVARFFEYDAAGRPTLAIPPVGDATLTEYDNVAGRWTKTSRGGTYFTLTTLDGFGRPVETEDAAGVKTRVTYDAEGHCVGSN